MDPIVNLRRQREIARQMLDGDDYVDTGDAVELAELVIALDDWRLRGGFDPYQPTSPAALSASTVMR
jgi:hypothetical protein